jgi:hypothetical protein
VPGPSTWLPGGSFWAFRKDPLAFLTNAARTYGDIAGSKFGPQQVYLVSRPEWIEDVLVKSAGKFAKGIVLERAKSLLGEGLLTASGPHHLKQRRTIQHLGKSLGKLAEQLRRSTKSDATGAQGVTEGFHLRTRGRRLVGKKDVETMRPQLPEQILQLALTTDEVHRRLVFEERPQDLEREQLWKGIHHPDMQPERFWQRTPLGRGDKLPAQAKNLFRIPLHHPTKFGDDNRPPGSPVERLSKHRLQLLHLCADRGLRRAQPSRCPADAALPRHHAEIAEVMVVQPRILWFKHFHKTK